MKLLLAFVMAAMAFSAVAADFYGVDVSTAVTEDSFKCMASEHDVSFVIVRCYRSVGSSDTNCPGTVKAARAAGISNIGVYHFPDTSQDPATQIRNSVAWLREQGVSYGTYWLDIERFAWSGNVTANTEFIGSMVSTLTSMGQTIGIYSGRYSWPAITGDVHTFDYLPLWYAHYEQPPNPSFSDYYAEGPYGGWSNPTMKQYRGGTPLCGANVDVDWMP